jgi:hypothetical protein
LSGLHHHYVRIGFRKAQGLRFGIVLGQKHKNANAPKRRFRDVHTVSIQVQGSIARMQSVGQVRLGLTPQQLILIP